MKDRIDAELVRCALIAVVVIIAGYFFWHWIVENVVTVITGGIAGGAAIEAARRKAKKAQTIADEHEDIADIRIVEATKEADNGQAAWERAQQASEDTTEPNHDLPPGFKRKSIRSR